jgi:hypothetical protein
MWAFANPKVKALAAKCGATIGSGANGCVQTTTEMRFSSTHRSEKAENGAQLRVEPENKNTVDSWWW